MMRTQVNNDIAVGVPMFSREQALQNCLDSLPSYIETAYVADNGAEIERGVYQREYPFSVEVLDLPYDCGIGKCRHEIAEACEEDYLWVGDNDMEITRENDLQILKCILENNPDLGGVSGWLIEDNTVRAGARNLRKHGSTAIKDVSDIPEMEGEIPFCRFDFIPQAGLFKSAVFDDYNYDPDVEATEHLDFFVAHQQTQWEFASTPAVVVKHNKWINESYRESERGGNHADMDITADKWGIETVVPGNRADWGYVRNRTIPQQAFDVFKRITPTPVWLRVRQSLRAVGLQ